MSYKKFKFSACFHCDYCQDEGLPEEKEDTLDVRKHCIKTWCYAINDVTPIYFGVIENCAHYRKAEEEAR